MPCACLGCRPWRGQPVASNSWLAVRGSEARAARLHSFAARAGLVCGTGARSEKWRVLWETRFYQIKNFCGQRKIGYAPTFRGARRRHAQSAYYCHSSGLALWARCTQPFYRDRRNREGPSKPRSSISRPWSCLLRLYSLANCVVRNDFFCHRRNVRCRLLVVFAGGSSGRRSKEIPWI